MRNLHLHPALALLFILSVMTFSYPSALWAEEESPSTVPRVSFGVVGMYGLNGMANQTSDDPERGGGDGRVERGYSYGGGLAFESMFNRFLGMHIELLYSFTHFTFKSNVYSGSPGMYYVSGSQRIRTDSHSIVMPLYLMPCYSYKRFTAGMLLGVHLGYIFKAKYSSSGLSFDAMKFVNYRYANIAGGLEFKFAVFRFVDVFVSAVAERGLTSYLDDMEGSSQRFYGYSARAGIMLRTF